jgi:hypothetical protein
MEVKTKLKKSNPLKDRRLLLLTQLLLPEVYMYD